ncbi:MAG: hypothetical protein LBV02_05430, partial [Bacteroidales bacterium]|nr:hypothetical protein [Bacteroidales bacterium]
MKKINPFSLILVPFSFLLVSLFFPLSAQSFQWSNHIGSTDDTYKRHDQILDAFVDGEDNSYFLVYFSSVNNVRFNGVTVSRDLNINYSNPFLGLFSFDCNGELRWYRTLRPVRVDSIMGTEYVYAVEIHHTASMARAGDKIVVALNALGNAHQLRIRDQDGNDTIFDRNLRGTNGVNLDPVVLFNFSGEVQWVKMPEVLFPTGIQNKSYRPMQNAMTLDADDNICRLIWNYSNFTESDGVSTPFPLVDSIDSYIVKYDLAGNLLQSVPVNLSGYGWGEPVFFCHNQQFHIFGSAGDYAVIN